MARGWVSDERFFISVEYPFKGLFLIPKHTYKQY